MNAIHSYSKYLKLPSHCTVAEFHPVQATNQRRIPLKMASPICTMKKVIPQHVRPTHDQGLLATDGCSEAETLQASKLASIFI